MSANPKLIETSTNKITTAWATLAPDATFGGMTLTQYKTKVKPSLDARAAIQTLEHQLTSATDVRDDADAVTSEANQKVIKGVVGDTEYGDDSDLYEAMGYVRKSERKSGLSRKKNGTNATQ